MYTVLPPVIGANFTLNDDNSLGELYCLTTSELAHGSALREYLKKNFPFPEPNDSTAYANAQAELKRKEKNNSDNDEPFPDEPRMINNPIEPQGQVTQETVHQEEHKPPKDALNVAKTWLEYVPENANGLLLTDNYDLMVIALVEQNPDTCFLELFRLFGVCVEPSKDKGEFSTGLGGKNFTMLEARQLIVQMVGRIEIPPKAKAILQVGQNGPLTP